MGILVAAPIAILIGLSFVVGMRAGAWMALLATLPIHWMEYSSTEAILQSLFSAGRITLNILLIVFSAVFLFHSLKSRGLIRGIEKAAKDMGKEDKIAYILYSIVPLFEGIAGFGTPGIIASPILVHLGVSPARAVASALLVDGIAVIFGAVGLPVKYGIGSIAEISNIPQLAAMSLAIVGIMFTWFVSRLSRIGFMKALSAYSIFAAVFIGMSFISFELATILGGIAVFLFYPLMKGMRPKIKEWMPYLLTAGVLGLMKAVRVDLPYLAFIGVAILFGKPIQSILPSLRKTWMAALVLFPTVMISQLLIHPDGGAISSLSIPSPALLSPLLGVLGAFVSGSNTVSNLMMGPLVKAYPEALAMLAAGGAIGNAVSFFNIITASSAVGLKRKEEVLRKTLPPTLLGLVILTFISALLGLRG